MRLKYFVRCSPEILFGTGLAVWLSVSVVLGNVAFGEPLSSLEKRSDFQKFQKQYQNLHDGFTDNLGKLSEERESAGDRAAVEELKALEIPVEREKLRVRKLPEEVQQELSGELPSEERAWRVRLRDLQKEYATNLYRLARQAVQKRFVAFAFDLIHETLVHDPDHSGARRVLGYRRIDKSWLTEFAAEMRKKKFEWSETYGWLPVEHIARYQNGERYCQGKWVSEARELEVRSNFSQAWNIRTEHFEIRTNYGLVEGVALARQLEDFHTAFFAIFAGSFTPVDQLGKLLEGGNAPGRVARPHRIYYFRTREEYLNTCQKKMPIDISVTLGLYIPGDQISYFYHPEDEAADVRRTVFHEAAHQLFSESRPLRQPIAVHANFWIVEGIACYMESFDSENQEFSLGDPGYLRFQNARDRLLGEKSYFVPLEKFSSMGMEAFQGSESRPMNYSQASGLTHFFMHYQDGLYREALGEYLSGIYSNIPRVRENPPTLEKLTGVSYPELDSQYARYLRDQQAELERAGR